MKLKKIHHPWWHEWFFTNVIEWGAETTQCLHGSITEYVLRECSKCDKLFRDERLRNYE